MRHRSFFASIATAALAGSLLLTGCSGGSKEAASQIPDKSGDFGFQTTGLPIVSSTLTLNFGGTKSSLAPAYSEMKLVQ